MRAPSAIALTASIAVLASTQPLLPVQARPRLAAMPCRSAAELVARKGAVVLATSSVTFDRFVRDQSFCERGEALTPARAATGDDPDCLVGYTCERTIGGIP